MAELQKMSFQTELKSELRMKVGAPGSQVKHTLQNPKPAPSTAADKQKLVLRLIDFIETI